MSNFNKKTLAVFKSETLFSGAMTALFIGLLVVANIIVYVMTSYFGLYIYVEEKEDLSLSGYTDSLFKSAIDRGEKVKIIFCQSEEDMLNNSNGKRVIVTAKNFQERYPDFIEIEYLNIITKRNSKGEYVDTSKYITTNESGQSSKLLDSSVIFESKYFHKVLTDVYSSTGYSGFYTVSSSGYSVSYNGEEVMAAMIMWTLTENHGTAYFTTYHGEIGDIGFSNMLTCAGYNVNTIDLRKSDIPSDASIVVISNPKKDFERAAEGSNIRTEIERLRAYLEMGGNLFVTIDPYVDELPVLEAFLGEYGIAITTTDGEGGKLRNIVRDTSNAITSDFFTFATKTANEGVGKTVGEIMAGYTDSSVIVKTSSALELSGNAQPLLISSASSTLYCAGKEVDKKGGYCLGAASSFATSDGGTASVVVLPSVYVNATDALVTEGYANRVFIYSVFGSVYGLEDLPYGCKTVYFADQILENLNMRTARIYTVCAFVIPLAVAVLGAVVIIRRKNR